MGFWDPGGGVSVCVRTPISGFPLLALYDRAPLGPLEGPWGPGAPGPPGSLWVPLGAPLGDPGPPPWGSLGPWGALGLPVDLPELQAAYLLSGILFPS